MKQGTQLEQAVFIVPCSGFQIVTTVQARSEFEARMWAINKVLPGHRTLCALGRWSYHLGPLCQACSNCYTHCRCREAILQ